MPAAGRRLWRLRRLHESIDAEVHENGGGVELRFRLNGALAYRRQWATRGEALADAASRRLALEREGWVFHW